MELAFVAEPTGGGKWHILDDSGQDVAVFENLDDAEEYLNELEDVNV